MQLADAIATEHRVLTALGDRIDGDGYAVFRAERWPTLYAANSIDVHAPGRRRLADLEALFERHFAPAVFLHRSFVLPCDMDGARLADEARAAGYEVSRLLYLVAEEIAPAPERPPEAQIFPVDRPARWELLRAFLHRSGDPIYGAEVVEMFYRRARALTDIIGVEWWYAGPPGGDGMLAKLGLFQHGSLGRLQDVETLETHRRRGLAGLLLRHAIRRALERGRGLVVCADADYHALALYRRLGFRDVGGVLAALRRPAAS